MRASEQFQLRNIHFQQQAFHRDRPHLSRNRLINGQQLARRRNDNLRGNWGKNARAGCNLRKEEVREGRGVRARQIDRG